LNRPENTSFFRLSLAQMAPNMAMVGFKASSHWMSERGGIESRSSGARGVRRDVRKKEGPGEQREDVGKEIR
jgi:hypothetical protein